MDSEKDKTTLVENQIDAHEILFNSAEKTVNEKHTFSFDFIEQMKSQKFVNNAKKPSMLPKNLFEQKKSNPEIVKSIELEKPQPTVIHTPNYDFIETNGKAEIKNKQSKKTKKRKFRAKLAVIVYSVLLLICVGWVTVNTIQISNTANEITQISYNIDTIQYVLKVDQLDCYNEGDETLITTIFEITPPALAQPTQVQPQTNWFDRFCSWLAGLFK
jgi:hypothetical protein